MSCNHTDEATCECDNYPPDEPTMCQLYGCAWWTWWLHHALGWRAVHLRRPKPRPTDPGPPTVRLVHPNPPRNAGQLFG